MSLAESLEPWYPVPIRMLRSGPGFKAFPTIVGRRHLSLEGSIPDPAAAVKVSGGSKGPGPEVYLRRRDNLRSLRGFPPVWQPGQ